MQFRVKEIEMSSPRLIPAMLLLLVAAPAYAQEPTELSCADFRPTAWGLVVVAPSGRALEGGVLTD